MPSSGGSKRRKKSQKSSAAKPVWQMQAVWIIGSALVLVALLWWVFGESRAPAPDGAEGVESTLRALAERHGVTPDELQVDAEIRKEQGVFVRTWKLRFPTSAAREASFFETDDTTRTRSFRTLETQSTPKSPSQSR